MTHETHTEGDRFSAIARGSRTTARPSPRAVIVAGGVERTSYPLLNDAEAGPSLTLSVFPAPHILGPLAIWFAFAFTF